MPYNAPRLMLFGDSIAAGLGARGRAYLQVTAEQLRMTPVDRSHTGWTVVDSLASYRASPESAQVAVIAHGITEPILRPVLPSSRLFPSRWRPRGWMDPRPYYSTSRRRRTLERVESGVRWRLKNWLIGRDSYQVVGLPDYLEALQDLTDLLVARGALVFMLQPPPLDDRYFPGSRHEQERYWEAARGHVRGTEFISLAGMSEWQHFLLDRFHPNQDGHAHIGSEIARSVVLRRRSAE